MNPFHLPMRPRGSAIRGWPWRAARQAGITVIAVTARDARQLVRDVVADRCGGSVAEYLVQPLADPEVDEVIAVFGELAALGATPRSRELLRRPVVVDLLVRSGARSTRVGRTATAAHPSRLTGNECLNSVTGLPEPFGPRKPVTVPECTRKLRPSTATVRPYRLVRP